MKSYRASTRQHCWYIILSFLVSSTVPATIAVDWDGVSVTQIDYEGLLAFKHALLDPSGYLRGWNGTGLDACSGAWEGIKCAQGQVIVIQLPWHGLGGTISEKIGQLTALRKLNLHDNALQGHVPSTIGLLPNLRGVYLFNNRLSGAIPPSIGNCLHLQTLDLSNNLITGNIPASISNSTSLYRLNLSYNKLVGSIPVGLARVPSLTFLSLHYNNLSGPIPDTWGGLGHHTNVTYHLQIVNLDGNSLSGTVPTSLSGLRTLQEVTLSNNRIGGSIPEELGEQLHMLQRLDLSHNSIGGNFPESLCNVSSLLHLDLEGNQLEDSIPETIGGLKNLTFLSLKRNRFRGQIPLALGSVANLSALDLSDNNLTGEIPRPLAQLTNLSRFNVSNNNLSGAVPLPLAERFDSTSFSGNIQLCGYATSVPCPSSSSSPSPPPSSPPPGIAPTVKPTTSTRKLSLRNIIVLVVVACAALLFVLCCVLLVCCLIRKREVLLGKKSDAAASASTAARQKTGGGGGAEEVGDAGGKLVHFDGPLVFTADDLLCATAEIMGKTGYGTVYKATLEDGNQVAVMRLREKISKNQKEFEAEVAVLGKIRHPNLLPLRAYYLGSKGEKLLVFDYMPKGSLATFLHERGPDTPMIEWGTRMKIATGIARGLLHLHTHESIIHGGLTSVNVLLDDDHNPRITDYGLSRLMTSAVATAGSLGYRAPELAKQKKASAKADVYSLGVVMLELLTGKSPGEAVSGLDLPQWVASIVEEKWTSEVFDVELARDGGAAQEAEMLGALKLALHCVDPAPAARPEVDHVLRQLREMRPELKEEGGGSGGVEEAGTTSGSSACV